MHYKALQHCTCALLIPSYLHVTTNMLCTSTVPYTSKEHRRCKSPATLAASSLVVHRVQVMHGRLIMETGGRDGVWCEVGVAPGTWRFSTLALCHFCAVALLHLCWRRVVLAVMNLWCDEGVAFGRRHHVQCHNNIDGDFAISALIPFFATVWQHTLFVSRSFAVESDRHLIDSGKAKIVQINWEKGIILYLRLFW